MVVENLYNLVIFCTI